MKSFDLAFLACALLFATGPAVAADSGLRTKSCPLFASSTPHDAGDVVFVSATDRDDNGLVPAARVAKPERVDDVTMASANSECE